MLVADKVCRECEMEQYNDQVLFIHPYDARYLAATPVNP
jgi:hypothetical protein